MLGWGWGGSPGESGGAGVGGAGEIGGCWDGGAEEGRGCCWGVLVVGWGAP